MRTLRPNPFWKNTACRNLARFLRTSRGWEGYPRLVHLAKANRSVSLRVCSGRRRRRQPGCRHSRLRDRSPRRRRCRSGRRLGRLGRSGCGPRGRPSRASLAAIPRGTRWLIFDGVRLTKIPGLPAHARYRDHALRHQVVHDVAAAIAAAGISAIRFRHQGAVPGAARSLDRGCRATVAVGLLCGCSRLE